MLDDNKDKLKNIILKFRAKITEFDSFIPKNVNYTLSNMLGMDYINRLEGKRLLSNHIDICTDRISKFLNKNCLIEDDISNAITLFTIAITESNKDYLDIYNQEKMNNKLNNIDVIKIKNNQKIDNIELKNNILSNSNTINTLRQNINSNNEHRKITHHITSSIGKSKTIHHRNI